MTDDTLAAAPSVAEPTSPDSPAADPAPAAAAERSPLSPRNFARLVLMLVGVVWTSIGLWAFADPVGFVDLMDLQLENATARLEIRAMYGGRGLGLAALSFAGTLRRAWMQPALVVALATVGGIATGRLISLGIDDFSAIGAGFMAAEYAGVGLVGFAMWRLVREKS